MAGGIPGSARRLFRRAHPAVLVALVALFIVHSTAAQDALPVLKASSTAVDIQDGDLLLKAGWVVDPAAALDVYDARRTTRAKRVTFITDVDSMSFDVDPGRTYDFIILLNGKDACRTRISTMAQGFRRIRPGTEAGPVTIPITISHGKLHLKGTLNGSQTLDFIFDTGADASALYPSAIRKGATLRFDGTTTNVGTGGATLRRTSSGNLLQIGGLAWEHESVLYVEKQADSADGIVGYTIFEDKILELDHDRMVMVIHDALPPHAAGFSKIPMPYYGSLRGVEVGLGGPDVRTSGLFALDTAGNGTMLINQAFADEHGLRDALKRIGAGTSRGVGSAAIGNEVVLLPELTLAGFTLRDVPINLELPVRGNAAPAGGVVCMDLLQRFSAILDYQRGEAYFKPGTHFGDPFRNRSAGPPATLVLAIALAAVACLAGLAVFIAKRRRNAPRLPAWR